ncbi:MAG: hypothetical protein ACRBN8_02330 [Nannocystales bacterium]
MEPTESDRLRTAFPTALRNDVERALAVLPPTAHPPTQDVGPVLVAGERIRIPHRIYSSEPNEVQLDGLSPLHRKLVACLYTRHHDGFVREKHLRELLRDAERWVVPFVIQLVGEYVLEVILLLESRAPLFQQPHFVTFARANPDFIDLTKQRAISYWDCYHRHRYPKLKDYPGVKLIEALERASATQAD